MQNINFHRHYVQRLSREMSQNDIIRALASPLINDERVVPDFAEQVIAREQVFPTGLPVEPVGVAIPHTDHKHVRQNAISIGILAEPVNFQDMGGEPVPVPVRVVFLLALSESNKQLNVLGWVMDIIQDGHFMQELLVMNDDDIFQSIYKKLSDRGEL